MSGEKWRATGWYSDPASPVSLFAEIASIGAYSSRANIAWRGMRSVDYDYISSLHRDAPDSTEEHLRSIESDLLEEAREWGLGYGVGGFASDLQLLADLQHYGTKTRLIDVTSDPMTALWFACQEVSDVGPSRSGVLVAIDTAEWPRYGRGRPGGTYSAVDDPTGWELREALSSGGPFIVESLHPNDRLRAQDGYFVASRVPEHRSPTTPFTGLAVPTTDRPHLPAHELLRRKRHDVETETRVRIPFMAVKVRSHLKPRIRRILENSYNRRARVLFPDFSGFLDHSRTAQRRSSSEEPDRPLSQ